MRTDSQWWARRGRSMATGLVAAWLVLGGAAGAVAGPAPAEGTEPAPAAGDEGEAAPSEAEPAPSETEAPPSSQPISVPVVRRDMEDNMAKLGDLANEAKRDADLVRAACVLDKRERAQGVMELATSEMLVIRDEGATPQERTFAAEKLQAASERLDDLVEQAKTCAGDKSPEDSDDETSNDSEEELTIPLADPTVGGAPGGGRPPPIPPPVDDGQPPTVGSPSV